MAADQSNGSHTTSGNVGIDKVRIDQLLGDQKQISEVVANVERFGIGPRPSLPRIIVAGNRSSGKSSVLRAISGLRFPLGLEVRPQFATEVTLRPDSRSVVSAQIRRLSDAGDHVVPFQSIRCDGAELSDIIKTAINIMVTQRNDPSTTMLQVEIRGPDVPHVTFVDLPGFFPSDKEHLGPSRPHVASHLLQHYTAHDNTVLLAVISATHQLNVQTALEKVLACDQSGKKTIGVITKPDMLQPGSQAEETILHVAKLPRFHTLRNRDRSQEEDTNQKAELREAVFFGSGSWALIPSQNLGAVSLRSKIGNVLSCNIAHYTSSLTKNIEAGISNRQKQLDDLGQSRPTLKESRLHVHRLASRLEAISIQALDGDYRDEFFGGIFVEKKRGASGPRRIRKLRTVLQDMNLAFSHVLGTRGCQRIFTDMEDQSRTNHEHELDIPSHIKVLVDIFHLEEPEIVSFQVAAAEIRTAVLANGLGFNPGSSFDRMVVELFKIQSQKWESIAQCYLRLVLDAALAFTKELLAYTAGPSSATYNAILSEKLVPFFDNKSRVLNAKLQELLHPHRSGRFHVLHASDLPCSARQLQKVPAHPPSTATECGNTNKQQASESSLRTPFSAEQLIERSQSHYEASDFSILHASSLRTFAENMVILAVENCLLEDIPGIFTTEEVIQMDDDEILLLTSESEDIASRRSLLQEECDVLNNNLKVLRPILHEQKSGVMSELDEPVVDPSLTAATTTRDDSDMDTSKINGCTAHNCMKLWESAEANLEQIQQELQIMKAKLQTMGCNEGPNVTDTGRENIAEESGQCQESASFLDSDSSSTGRFTPDSSSDSQNGLLVEKWFTAFNPQIGRELVKNDQMPSKANKEELRSGHGTSRNFQPTEVIKFGAPTPIPTVPGPRVYGASKAPSSLSPFGGDISSVSPFARLQPYQGDGSIFARTAAGHESSDGGISSSSSSAASKDPRAGGSNSANPIITAGAHSQT
ncbi:putative GED domain-containing protein [Seiridium cardinale]|uniref:GED domain-containing protein n=1 Tax=Seiridium cardinale TaxID=138064 RepID=A0ABR2Y1Z9_9PEZI